MTLLDNEIGIERQPLTGGRTRRAVQALVGLSAAHAVVGRDALTNDELAARFPGRTAEAIRERCGVVSRHRMSGEQSLAGMASEAARAALAAEGLGPGDLDLILCSTLTPPNASPSVACMVLGGLGAAFGGSTGCPAFDLSAACSGYLYALSTAWDFLHSRPRGRVLVVTAEAMSQIVDPNDFGTAVVFGDAATATVVSGRERQGGAAAVMARPALAARADRDGALLVPPPGCGRHLKMDGRRVFNEAVRGLLAVLGQACNEAGLGLEDLDWVVPHQASGRIIAAVAERLAGASPAVVVDDVANRGNTSSSSIPLALPKALAAASRGDRVGLCAFGAGFTSAAAVLQIP